MTQTLSRFAADFNRIFCPSRDFIPDDVPAIQYELNTNNLLRSNGVRRIGDSKTECYRQRYEGIARKGALTKTRVQETSL